MKPTQTSLFAALLAICFSYPAHAQWSGTYEYQEKGFTGKMVVTDVSMCVTENLSARIGSQTELDASFPVDKTEGKPASWIDVEFRRGAAVVKLNGAGTPTGTCEGTGRFVGKWRKM
jgi:hypothetical protein